MVVGDVAGGGVLSCGCEGRLPLCSAIILEWVAVGDGWCRGLVADGHGGDVLPTRGAVVAGCLSPSVSPPVSENAVSLLVCSMVLQMAAMGAVFPSVVRRAVAGVVVASSCRLLGSCVGFLSELYGVLGMGGLCVCSRLAHPEGISNLEGVGVALGGAMPFDFDDDPFVR